MDMQEAEVAGSAAALGAAPLPASALKLRKQANAHARHCVVKCSLPSRVRHAALRPAIEALVSNVSQYAHKASLLLNAVLLRACAGRGPAWDALDASQSGRNAFLQLFYCGSVSSAKVDAPLREAWDDAFASWPLPPRLKGDTQAMAYAAQLLHTNFVVSCTHAFDARQKAHIRRFIQAQQIDAHGAVWATQCAVNGWNCKTPLPPDQAVAQFVTAERAALGLQPGQSCDERWRKANLPAVVRYYYRILVAAAAHPLARKFSLAPLCSIKRHFVTIDTKILRALVGDKALSDEALWELSFKNLRLRGGAWAVAPTVQTDGVALCVRLVLAGAVEPPPPRVAGAKRKRGDARPSAAPAAEDGGAVLAIDPGRSTLMHGVARVKDPVTGASSLKQFMLTRAALYNRAGKPFADKRRARWERVNAVATAALSAASPKTHDYDALRAYISVVRAHYGALWSSKLQKKHAREDLRFYRRKHAVMDGWLNRVKAALGPRARVAYGSASFAASGKGESAPAPTDFQYKRLCLAFGAGNVSLVDEYCSSKCCAACGQRGKTSILQTVVEPDRAARRTATTARRLAKRQQRRSAARGRGPDPDPPVSERVVVDAAAAQTPRGARPELRGLKRCSSTECCSYVSRDANAAVNILQAYEASARGAPRPRHLARDNTASAARPTRVVLHRHDEQRPIGIAGYPPSLAEGQSA